MIVFKVNKGATSIEYGLLLALIGVLSITGALKIGELNNDVYEGVASKVQFSIQEGVGETDRLTDPQCYDPAQIGAIAPGDWGGCGGMLIVDEAMMGDVSSPAFHHGSGSFSISGPDGYEYSFENSERNIFTGQVRRMQYLFAETEFDGDISYWDTSNVHTMSGLFSYSIFNQDISGWDVSGVGDMRFMFYHAGRFNQDIGSWDVSAVIDTNVGSGMLNMFLGAGAFTQDLSQWCVAAAEYPGPGFDASSGFEGEVSLHPVWGTCPA